ncbi:2-amino-4-hydroxy-6-hydroxymethyldihydropteridine diphosphokinase [Cellulosilyticum sp. I15G10I2]|uniref:2-amino-4-hydroxy-6- hydroxymethyldihydropteridine diphosphokinase n=1 Tax=Cellulosilyticum sp. I15G10I2 TaxID=1892843 RepID=UPI00085CC731|nr:2-amino-4-hydroxy-6-hydroxymethyldihydropteridine diphosphokinase [Cellulosilyticum sp. I15G10I2]
MDKIYIQNLEVFAHHGVFEEEKRLGQKFLISMVLTLDLRSAALSGDLKQSVHYGELCEGVEAFFKETSYDLIETAAEKTAEFVLQKYPGLQSIKLTIKKPWAPILKSVDYVAVEITRGWHTAYIGLGSNIGDKEANLKEALKHLAHHPSIRGVRCSSFIETEPWGYLNQEKFLNAATELRTLLTPKELMGELLRIEQLLKRERTIKWGPRTIDLDLLLYDDLVTHEDYVTVPHPRIEERAFVLEPLCELAPMVIHPLLGTRLFQLLEALKK